MWLKLSRRTQYGAVFFFFRFAKVTQKLALLPMSSTRLDIHAENYRSVKITRQVFFFLINDSIWLLRRYSIFSQYVLDPWSIIQYIVSVFIYSYFIVLIYFLFLFHFFVVYTIQVTLMRQDKSLELFLWAKAALSICFPFGRQWDLRPDLSRDNQTNDSRQRGGNLPIVNQVVTRTLSNGQANWSWHSLGY